MKSILARYAEWKARRIERDIRAVHHEIERLQHRKARLRNEALPRLRAQLADLRRIQRLDATPAQHAPAQHNVIPLREARQ